MDALLLQVQQHAADLPLPLQAELLNYTLYLEQKARDSVNLTPKVQRLEDLSKAFEQAAALNPYREITDPIKWQQEQRQDRPLPGRDHADR